MTVLPPSSLVRLHLIATQHAFPVGRPDRMVWSAGDRWTPATPIALNASGQTTLGIAIDLVSHSAAVSWAFWSTPAAG
jgi:hypothetical protein